MKKEQFQTISDKIDVMADKSFLLTEGQWVDKTPWQFIVSQKEPNPALCTAVFNVTTYKGKLLLVQNKTRGWELPGGHIDEGEQLKEALEREVLEETGAVIKNPKIFGHKKISPHQPVPYRDRPGMFYPFPHSYVPYYFAEASEIFDTPLAPDVIGMRAVGLEEAKKLLAVGHNHDEIIEHLVKNKQIHIDK
jgi:8-oxo-dGTP pyrophosphatase MutT (NUDIX family)